MMQHLKMAVQLARETVMDIKKQDPLDPGMGVLELFRGGEPVANVFMVDVPDEQRAHCVFSAISWMRADMAVYSDETWTALQDINPDTGETWVEFGLSEYVEAHPEDYHNVVSEAILVAGINSAGDVHIESQAYRAVEVTPGEWKLQLGRFDSIDSNEEKEIKAGPIGVMRAGMNKTAETAAAVVNIFTADDAGHTLLEAEVLADYYGLKHLSGMGAKCALTTHNLEYAKVLQELTGETMHGNLDDAIKALNG